ncbi:MAG: hypothetical protein MN733_15540 [Nitrososphaera sp.]|nr:hypothetical protein [Nitrososphaera sp.]
MGSRKRQRTTFGSGKGRSFDLPYRVDGCKLDVTKRYDHERPAWRKTLTLDLSFLQDRPELLHLFLHTLGELSMPGSGVNTFRSLQHYNDALRDFSVHFLSRNPRITKGTHINRLVVDEYLDDLRQRKQGTWLAQLTNEFTRVLNHVRRRHPDAIGIHDRIVYRHPQLRKGNGIQPYSDAEAKQLLTAAKKEVNETLNRILVEAPRLIAEGVDPRDPRYHQERMRNVHGRYQSDRSHHEGWNRLSNLLWFIVNVLHGEYYTKTQLEKATIHGRGWNGDAFRSAAGELCGGVTPLYRYLYPHIIDLVPFMVALAFRGMNKSSILSLRRSNIEKTDDRHVRIYYGKGRAHGQDPRTFTLKGSHSIGAILMGLLEITKPLISKMPPRHKNDVWIFCAQKAQKTSGYTPVRSLNNFSVESLSTWKSSFQKKHNLLTDDGLPLFFSFQRARETWLIRDYEKHGAVAYTQFEARHRTPKTTTEHYLRIQKDHTETIAEGLQDCLNEFAGIVITASRNDPDALTKASMLLNLSKNKTRKILHGEQDVYTNACKDFYNRPDGMPNTPCNVPWLCLWCKNAIYTRRTLPKLLGLLNFLVRRRDIMRPEEWLVYGERPFRIITEFILPKFPQTVIDEAKKRASEDANYIALALRRMKQ